MMEGEVRAGEESAVQTGRPLVVAVVTGSSNTGKACIQHLVGILLQKAAGTVGAQNTHSEEDDNADAQVQAHGPPPAWPLRIQAGFRTQEKADAVLQAVAESHALTLEECRRHVTPFVGVDAEDAASLDGVFEGASVAVIVTPMSARGFEGDSELSNTMADVAVKKCGVKHIVYVGSWTVLAPEQVSMIAARFVPTEQHLKSLHESDGATWTFLRSGYFNTNFLHMFPAQLRASCAAEGVYSINFPDVALPSCDPRDIGRAAAVICRDMAWGTEDDKQLHISSAYDISGSEVLTSAQIIDKLSSALGKDITYNPVPAASLSSRLPPYLAQLMLYLEAAGKDAIPCSTHVKDLVGHVVSLDEWLEEFGSAFIENEE